MSDQPARSKGSTKGDPAKDDPGRDESTQGLSYESAREELVAVVGRLEAGGTSLEESLELWERGEKLARVCQEWLDGARKRLDAAIEADED